MNPVVKKILQLVISALVGSGITVVVTEGVAINCKPVITTGGSGE